MQTKIDFALTESILEVSAEAWDALHDGHPALRHAFLAALESSSCVGAASGWRPSYLVGRCGDALVAAVPLFLKNHSYGEYVFDWAWADAFERHGLSYYPKWLVAPPFSPLPGTRLLGRDEGARRGALQALLKLAEDSGLSSLHVLFPQAAEAAWMCDAGLLLRTGVQFHWNNRGYAHFADFLAQLNHEKRKKIRQDRKRLAGLEMDYVWLDGFTANADDWAYFARCYEQTYRAHRSTPYLNEAFFLALARSMPESVRLLIARRAGLRVASALFLCDRQALYGRYWGSTAAVERLHFELCYYRPIEYCIEHRLARMEGGAQGEHKLSRGLEPVTTYSAHWIAEPRFRDAIDRHLAAEGEHMSAYLDELETRTPFRKPMP